MSGWRTQVTWRSWWAETIVSSGGLVSQWTDGSGNGRHYIQSNGSLKPALGGTGFNGNPWILFAWAGSGTFLVNNAVVSDVVSASAGYVVAAVNLTTIHSANVTYQDDACFGDSVNGYIDLAFDTRTPANAAGPPGTVRAYIWDGGERTAKASFSTNVTHVVEMWWNGSNIFVRVDGGATVTGDACGAIQVLSGFITAGKYIDGGMGALACINSVPSLSDRDAIVASMRDEFAPYKLAGTTPLVFGQSGALAGAGALAGTSALAFNEAGTLTGLGALAGSTALSFAAAATLAGAGALAGTVALTFSETGALVGSGALAGSSAFTFGESGLLLGAGALVGSTSIVFDASGTLTASGATGVLEGTTSIAFGQSGDLRGSGAIAGTAAFAFATTATPQASGALAGSVGVLFATSGTLGGMAGIAGTSGFSFDASGTLVDAGAISGTTSMAFSQAGYLTGSGELAGETGIVFYATAEITATSCGVYDPTIRTRSKYRATLAGGASYVATVARRTVEYASSATLATEYTPTVAATSVEYIARVTPCRI